MIADFKPSERVTETEYELQFYVDASGGFAFPCDEYGNVFIDQMNDDAKKNYDWCLKNPDKFPYRFNKVRKYTHTYRVHASGICHCGERIFLTNDYCGACECPNCGQWWNLFGEELIPPDNWEDYGDVIDYDY